MLRELSAAGQRYRAVLAVIEDGLSVTEAAAKGRVSRQTLHSWLGRYAAGGLEGRPPQARTGYQVQQGTLTGSFYAAMH